MAIALFNPKPIRKSECRTKGQRLTESNGPRRRKEQIIDREDDGWDGVEADVRQQAQLEFLGDDEFFVYGHQAAV